MIFLARSILFLLHLTTAGASLASAQEFNSDNWFPVYVNGKAGYIDRTGKIVLEPKFDGASYFSEGLARVSFGRDTIITEGFNQGFIDENGKVVIEPKWDAVSHFSEGLACVKIGGDVVKPVGMSITKNRGRYAFIDKTGKEVIKLNDASCRSFSEGLASFEKHGIYGEGFIDKTGKVMIPPNGMGGQSDFSDGLKFVIRNEGKLGYIDRTGALVLDLPFGKMDDFCRGLALVCESYDFGAKCGYIDKTGKVIWPPSR